MKTSTQRERERERERETLIKCIIPNIPQHRALVNKCKFKDWKDEGMSAIKKIIHCFGRE